MQMTAMLSALPSTTRSLPLLTHPALSAAPCPPNRSQQLGSPARVLGGAPAGAGGAVLLAVTPAVVSVVLLGAAEGLEGGHHALAAAGGPGRAGGVSPAQRFKWVGGWVEEAV